MGRRKKILQLIEGAFSSPLSCRLLNPGFFKQRPDVSVFQYIYFFTAYLGFHLEPSRTELSLISGLCSLCSISACW